jgi:hypothetical protein
MSTRFRSFLPARAVFPRISKIVYDDGILQVDGHDLEGLLRVRVLFPDPLFVRISDEGVRLRLQQEIGADQSFIFTDEDSPLLAWVAEEGLHTREMQQARHFIIVIGEEIVDVVSFSGPEVKDYPLCD